MARCLLIVDPQYDFIEGALPVPDAKAAMQSLAEYLRVNKDAYTLKLITCDFHPWDHCSFQENGGLWPRHCIAHSQGASICPDLLSCLYDSEGETIVIPKGMDSATEEYSVFQNPGATHVILSKLQAHGVDSIDICGLAGDVCVLTTLREGIKRASHANFNLLKNFSPSLDGGKSLSDFCAQEAICIK